MVEVTSRATVLPGPPAQVPPFIESCVIHDTAINYPGGARPRPNRRGRGLLYTMAQGEEYDFVEHLSEIFLCPVMHTVLLEPYQTKCCGNHISQEAYQRLHGQPCPVCREANFTAVMDKFHKRNVMSLNVRCSHKAKGCEWEGTLRSLEEHLNITRT